MTGKRNLSVMDHNDAVSTWPAAAPKRIFVVGAGRSGTSLLAGLFRKSGLFMGDNPYLARDANPLGFFEDREVNDINEDLLAPVTRDKLKQGQRWLASIPTTNELVVTPEIRRRILAILARGPMCIKDPRFCYTLDLWIRELPLAEQDEVNCLCVFRRPSVVVTSVQKELETAPYLKDLNLTKREILAAWCNQYRQVLEKQRKLGRWLFIDYEELFEPRGLARLRNFTGLEPDERFVQPDLRRSRGNESVNHDVTEIYDSLIRLARKASWRA